MISFIEGTLVEKNPAVAVVAAGGLGYQLHISLNTYSKLPDPGARCLLYTHLSIRNEAATPVGLSLYGFYSEEEKSIFLGLTSVNGVGSNTARLILSSLSTSETVAAIVNGQAGVFEKVKGIGSKTAQKIIIDLKGKFAKAGNMQDFLMPVHNTKRDEALSGLTLLGFNKNAAEKAIDKILRQAGADIAVEELIKQALKIL